MWPIRLLGLFHLVAKELQQYLRALVHQVRVLSSEANNYMQQLRELVNLHEIGALTTEEYEHERRTLVELMKNLNTPSL